MNSLSACVIAVTLFWSSTAIAGDPAPPGKGRPREIEFAEKVVTGELIRALSPTVRTERRKCGSACAEIGTIELGIGLLGINRSESSSTALLNLLGLRLDGAGSEELSCQVIGRGATMLQSLRRLSPSEPPLRCQKMYAALRARELTDVVDVQVEQVCRTPQEVQAARDELVRAIVAKVKCEK